MNSPTKRILLLMAVWAVILTCQAQRKVTPVEPPRTVNRPAVDQPRPVDPSRLVHTHDSKGNVVVIDTVTGTEVTDTLPTSVPKMIYPTIYKVTAGVNIWDLAMRCFKQRFGLGGVWAELNLHNRYLVFAEAGLGTADISPSGLNYTYKSPLAPYFKIGGGYNMFYNSNPAYQFCVGLRYGFSPFKYSVEGIVDDSYWGEQTLVELPSQSATAGYLEVTAGVRVKIVGNFSMGWNLIWHKIIHESRAPYGKPMYIPGYGKRSTTFTADLSLIWNFCLNQPAAVAVE